jgi:uncharacterized protein
VQVGAPTLTRRRPAATSLLPWTPRVEQVDLVVGFDLDLTLVDSRPSVIAIAEVLSREEGVPVDGALWASRIGPPLEQELAVWFPAQDVDRLAGRFRALLAEFGIARSLLLPGAREAIEAVKSAGGRVVVITGKQDVLAHQTLAFVGLEVDEVVGWVWREQKGVALRERGAQVYVGDHADDVIGARLGGALSYGVRTGGSEPVGADVLADDLLGFPAWLEEHLLERRLQSLEGGLRELGSVLVAFSGGADSAFLLAAAVRTLGADHVVAATAVSASLATEELPAAAAFAQQLGARHLTPGTDELSREGYVANGADRCFHCKATLLDTLRPLAHELGLAHVATGTNADDVVAGFRPGIRAAAQRGAATPLLDAGLTKAQIREASRRWGLVTADKPALACLASRIAYGIAVTPLGLARVDRAETALRALLRPTDVRVRDLGGDTARVELDPVALAVWSARAEALVQGEGFVTVAVGPFRSGSMNDLLVGAGAPEQPHQGDPEADG